ncbi:PREDICTED: uncharacterized protein LOC108564558 isoform X2 [Nicrophorus vespilloides]|uniref:Uncharacterized protein LOC108564558 isoform X2 n=1 Tax=Nicrophorus vespilloides TaxID=110193 RepID=A0ABM1MX23_NICVS|nr:PREDICTED: uncharacterized protein LOC108564558 isoform X2 [Nicrophorus vespilloides]
MEMRSTSALLVLLAIYLPAPLPGQRLVPPRKYQATDDDDDGSSAHRQVAPDVHYDTDANYTEDGMFLGSPCETTCGPNLIHVFCNPETKYCECEKKYPVRLNPAKGCDKPKKLGDQCYYKETCEYTDPHASCLQVHHNAVCKCIPGYHSVTVNRPSKKLFCAEDLEVMTTDLSTLAGVVSGIAVLSGLICFVLKLFNQNLYTGRHRYGNANLAPPILFNSDAETIDFLKTPYSNLQPINRNTSQPMYGSFLAVRDVTGSVPIIDRRLVSRASSQRTLVSSSRRPSSAPGCRGIAVSASRAGAARAAAILLLSYHATLPEHSGSRRPSIASVHSGNSIRSYSMRRYEKEREQKEEREMQRRLARLQSSMNSSGRVAPTPSPHSTDDLLPTLEEDKSVPLAISEESASTSFQEDIPSTSKQYP